MRVKSIKIFWILLSVLMTITPVVWASESRFCSALSDDETYVKKRTYKKLIEGQDGWIFRTKTDFNENFKMNSALRMRFTRMNTEFQEQGIKLVISLLPTRGMLHHDLIDYPDYDIEKAMTSYTDLAKGLRKLGISVAAVSDFSSGQDYFYKKDHHWNSSGAKAMAQIIAAEVKKLPAYTGMPKKKFKTEKTESIPHSETFTTFINKTCGRKDTFGKHPIYKTYEVGGSEEDLFGESSDPDILLLGTSNSVNYASNANFDGFLREYIGADVENLSVSGGGVDTAMLDWLSSQKYKEHKPKILIWEIPVHQNFKGGPFYRQAIPAIHGDCGNDAVLLGQSDIEDRKFKIYFSKGDMQKISAKKHYLYLKFSNFKGRKFRSTIVYGDKKKESFDFRRSKYFKPDGIFFLDFDKLDNDNISLIRGLMPKDATGNVIAKVCRYKN